MALVSQEIVLFDLTVAENIAVGCLLHTRTGISRHTHAQLIIMLPDGYDTRIGERGVTLSGGQRQRLAIARAFVRNAPILVLDEATAALDSKAETEVQAAIDRLSENRTVLCVAHRLSTLRTMDRIIVLSRVRPLRRGCSMNCSKRTASFAAWLGRRASPDSGYQAKRLGYYFSSSRITGIVRRACGPL